MGSLFTRYFLKRGYEVAGFDKRRPRRFSQGFRFARSNADAVREAEFVLVAVPAGETVRAVDEVLPFMKQMSTLVEMTSVKGRIPSELGRKLGEKGLFLLSLHPLFGPLGRVEGSKICVVGSGRDMSVARRLFPKAQLIRMRSTDHDRMMVFALSLVHLTNIAFISTLVKGIGVRRFEGVAPPLGAVQLSVGKAVLSSSPSLFGRIHVGNPFVTEMLSSLIEELEGLKNTIAKNDVVELEKKFSSLAAEFRRTELDAALEKVYAWLYVSPPAKGAAI